MGAENLIRKQLSLKSFSPMTDAGTFEGLLSPYGKVDQGGDRIVKGAYAKSIQQKGTKYPLLWQHKSAEPIGSLYVEDREDGLYFKAQLELGVQKAREALILIKKEVIDGMSI